MRKNPLSIVIQVGLVVLVLAAWQISASRGIINSFSLGNPRDIFDQIWAWIQNGTLLRNAASTIVIFLIGYAIGTVVGSAVGFWMGVSPFARSVLEPYVVFLNATPRIILFPFFVIWLGFGAVPKILTVVLVIVTIVAFNVMTGVTETPTDILANCRALGAGRIDILLHVYAPALATSIISTSRVTVGYALQATVVSQFVGAANGLGYLVNFGREELDVDQVFAALLAIVVIAVAVDGLLGLAEKRVTRWM